MDRGKGRDASKAQLAPTQLEALPAKPVEVIREEVSEEVWGVEIG